MAEDLSMIFLIGFIPLVGGVFQTLVYGILSMWSSAGFALVLSYIYLQERMVHIDQMTGTWTRESFYYTFTRRIRLMPQFHFGAIYLDIDNLKRINDQFGHSQGDKAIISLVNVIKSMIQPSSCFARLGGDEFIIVLDNISLNQLSDLVQEMEMKLKDIGIEGCPCTCSFGFDLFNDQFDNLDDFVHHIDQLMYIEKNKKKGLLTK